MADAAGDTTDPTYLAPTPFIDSDHPTIVAYARETIGDASEAREAAVRLFYKVRDSIRYDPYTCRIDPDLYRASVIAESDANFCIPKAILLTALARAAGIPARLGFADVRNHLASDKLLERMGTDVFAFHGYSELALEGRWVKATPAFNLAMCERFGVLPLEFDGRSDAIFHPFDASGQRHMEYIRDRGSFADFPFEEMVAAFQNVYGSFFGAVSNEDQVDAMFHDTEKR